MQSELSLLEQNGASRDKSSRNRRMVLEMADGTAYEGIGFGAEGKSISGECVFQTGPLSSRFACKGCEIMNTLLLVQRHGWLP